MESRFAARRAQVMQTIGPRAVLVLPGATQRHRNGDVTFRFRQDSDFWYLTGFDEPDALAVLAPGRDKPYTLFVPPRDREREIWNGRRAGVEGAVQLFGADEAFSNADIQSRGAACLENADDLYFALGRDAEWDTRVTGWLEAVRALDRRGIRAPARILEPRELLGEMRLRKDDSELSALRRAATITAEAHEAAMRAAKDGAWEYEIEALIEYVFRKNGGKGAGYTTIVGAGANATILHYVENRSRLKAGQLLLVDAGCEYDFYTADVTRTVPIGGIWTQAARAVYEVVLAAQEAAIEAVQPGTTLESIHARAVEVLVEGLCSLKLLGEPKAEAIEKGTYKKYYMHRTSHWLGLDVHDAGGYRKGTAPRPLEPGFVLTIEPGLYFDAAALDVPEAYRGVGVRIEDDVLVTAEGHEVLTAAVPKKLADLDRIVAHG